MIVHWSGGGLPEDIICGQYHHVTDIVPTLLGLTGHPGESVDGISFAYTFDSPDAPTRKQIQFYETAGDRAIWVDGWKAVTQHRADTRFEEDYWALYQDAGVRCGENRGAPISRLYRSAFGFDQILERVTVELEI